MIEFEIVLDRITDVYNVRELRTKAPLLILLRSKGSLIVQDARENNYDDIRAIYASMSQKGWDESSEEVREIAIRTILIREMGCPVCKEAIGLCPDCLSGVIDQTLLSYFEMVRDTTKEKG